MRGAEIRAPYFSAFLLPVLRGAKAPKSSPLGIFCSLNKNLKCKELNLSKRRTF